MKSTISITTKHFIKVLCCILTTCNYVTAQTNLVPNPSFEQYTICPDNSSLYTGANSKPDIWYKPDSRGAGYFNSCANSNNAGVPIHSLAFGTGFQFARTGNAYIGMYYLNNNSNNYFQAKLLDSLKPNKYYYAECYINLDNISNWGCNNQGMLFTKKAVYVDTANYTFMLASPQIVNYGNPIITDTLNWVKVSGTFKAQGGEQFLTLGNFKLANNTQKTTLQTTGNYAAGYYVDDVAVYPLDSICLKADAGRDTTIKVNDSVFIGSYTNGIDTIKWYNASGQVIDSTKPGFWVKPTTTGTTMYVVEQTVNGCTTRDTVYINAVLPLKFLSYNVISNVVRNLEQSAENIFTTANEINVSHYNIQRSTNAKDFTAIGIVRANNKSYNEYEFIDELKTKDQDLKTLYYRIESIDFDGKKQYSQVKSLIINNSQLIINVFPNPAKDIINIQSQEAITQIKIINQLGQTIQQINQHPTTNTKQSINVQQYPRGIYLIQITTSKNEIINQKLVIN